VKNTEDVQEDLRDVLRHSKTFANSHLRRLRGRTPNVHNLGDLQRHLTAIAVSCDLTKSIMTYCRHNLPDSQSLPEDSDILLNLEAEMFNLLEVPVPSLHDPSESDTHNLRCTGTTRFRNQDARNDWVWVQVGDEEEYGALRGRLPASLVVLFKVRNPLTQCSHRLALVRMLRPVDGGRIGDTHGLVKASRRTCAVGGDLWIVSISSILGMAHLVVCRSDGNGPREWFINSRIDLQTFNWVY